MRVFEQDAGLVRKWVQPAIRIGLGIFVFATLLVVASPLPLAAGIMLTFPAKNGLVLINDDPRKAIGTASTMLFLPVINASLCALFILGYWMLATSNNYVCCASMLLLLIVLIWSALFWFRDRFTLPIERHFTFALACTIVCALLTIAFALIIRDTMPGADFLQSTATSPRQGIRTLQEFVWSIPQLLQERWLRIVLFSVAMLIVVVCIEGFDLPATLKGFLGGLPIVPFGALFAMGVDQATAENPAAVRGLASGIWLAPVVPVFFILGLSRYFTTTTAGIVVRSAVLVGAWITCFAAIFLLSAAVTKLF